MQKTLSELLPAFNSIEDNSNPALIGEVSVTIRLFIGHTSVIGENEDKINSDCEVVLEVSSAEMDAQLEKVNPLVTVEGLKAVTPEIRIEDVIKAFQLDINTPAWELYYQ